MTSVSRNDSHTMSHINIFLSTTLLATQRTLVGLLIILCLSVCRFRNLRFLHSLFVLLSSVIYKYLCEHNISLSHTHTRSEERTHTPTYGSALTTSLMSSAENTHRHSLTYATHTHNTHSLSHTQHTPSHTHTHMFKSNSIAQTNKEAGYFLTKVCVRPSCRNKIKNY